MIAPLISPISIILTYGMLGFHFALFRLLFTLLFSLFIAYLSLYLFTHKETPLKIEEKLQGRERSIPIYVCSGEEVLIAGALFELSFTPGQAMVFILAGSGGFLF